MAYQWILFDLDDTLFDFPAADALRWQITSRSIGPCGSSTMPA